MTIVATKDQAKECEMTCALRMPNRPCAGFFLSSLRSYVIDSIGYITVQCLTYGIVAE